MVRNAIMKDAKIIQQLVNSYAKNGEMLPLSINEVYENILKYFVYEEDDKIYGCCALFPSWEDLAEIRSLAVFQNEHKRGIGRILVEHCIKKAKELGITKVFALTYKVEFFEKLGFKIIDKEKLPKKIWSDCLKCSKFPDCDEIAVIKEI
ncbi:N-acetyltransferase [Deferribacter autotrophicus]|uniref:N-acetyltransferase n=1 Tax=Deferribacter autotrophicus TaxID=500465 RepID=A0A5A8F0M3_9BACT|nr:N-acetyltransferase [Deferribacter autotrophicus]KAA0257418.1 N-acetyltransferase [Deferribacter autotrophicus]